MLDYLSTLNDLHTRMVDFTLQEYMFVMQVALGEDETVAYASVFDTAEFKRNVPSEDEEEYLRKFKKDARDLLESNVGKQLRQYIEKEFDSEVQSKATKLKDFRFTGAEIQKLLNNLLHNRASSLDDASVKDIIQLIKGMYDSGAVDNSSGFESHFISVPKKYDCICRNCNREMYLVEGCDNKCPACGAIYYWRDNRFYPNVTKL